MAKEGRTRNRSWPCRVEKCGSRNGKEPRNIILKFGIGARRLRAAVKLPGNNILGEFMFYVFDARGKDLKVVCDINSVSFQNGRIFFDDDVSFCHGKLLCDEDHVPFEIKDRTVRCSDLRKAVLEWKLNKK